MTSFIPKNFLKTLNLAKNESVDPLPPIIVNNVVLPYVGTIELPQVSNRQTKAVS